MSSPISQAKLERVYPILSKISFLGGIPDDKLSVIFKWLEAVHYEPGECICHEGDEPSHIYIIEQGKVDLMITMDGATVKKRSFETGDSFGEAALLSLINNTATFVAAEPTDIWQLSRKSLNALRAGSPDIFSQLILNLARDLARKLQYTDEMLAREQMKSRS